VANGNHCPDPVGENTFIDRSYWVEVKLERDAEGRPVTLVYDHFQGKAPK